MQFCHQCGYNLTLGIEKFCPKCGYGLDDGQEGGIAKSPSITDNPGDVFGIGFNGDKNIIAKDTEGNVFYFNIGSVTKEQIRSIIASPTTLDISSISYKDGWNKDTEGIQKATETKQQTSQVLDELKKIEKEEGVEIREIKVGELQISKDVLSLKELLLKGNEHYYKTEYNEAIECYDKALELDASSHDAWFDKGCALGEQKKHNEAIECYDKALRIKPYYAYALYNKGNVLNAWGMHNEAIECYDKALRIKPDFALALNYKGVSLSNLGKYIEAFECYDKALRIKPNYIAVLNNKGYAFYNLRKYDEAIECYDKALRIKPDFALALNNKHLAQEKLKKSNNGFFSWFKN